jgi:glyoxylase-like metal-dependent hydrolase (beta-lactamase superfamily II)
MKCYPIEAGKFKLDGGAMFGVVPKSLWSRTNPADQDNLIDIGARCLLIEDGNRLILIDTGMGNKQSDKFFSHYKPWGKDDLEQSITNAGFHRDDITDVFMTHLHFDHCGGGVEWNANRTGYNTVFKNATYWTNEEHWLWATQPNPREKASFLSENLNPIEASGQLSFIEKKASPFLDKSELGFGVLFVDGHTDKQMIPHIRYHNKTLVFAADLIPTAGHIPIPYIMGYDTRPLISMTEKERFLKEAADNEYYLFLEHDAYNPIITVKNTEKGVRLHKSFTFEEIFN